MKIPSSIVGAFKSRTIWLASLTTATGIAYDQASWIRTQFPLDHHAGKIAYIIACAFAFLRFATSTSLAEKAPRKDDAK